MQVPMWWRSRGFSSDLSRAFLAALALGIYALAQQAAPIPPQAATSTSVALADSLWNSFAALRTGLSAVSPQHWHAKNDVKQQFSDEVAALQRNVIEALPNLVAAVHRAPENVGVAFRLYRDAEAVYAVALRCDESVHRYAQPEEISAVTDALASSHQNLNALAHFIEVAGDAQAQQLARLRAAAAASPPAKTLVIPDANSTSSHSHRAKSRKKSAPAKKSTRPPR